MIINFQKKPHQTEIEVQISCEERNDQVIRIENAILSTEKYILAKKDTDEFRIYFDDIFYIESVDRKTFIYTAVDVFYTDYKLYQILDMFKNEKICRVSKACLINVSKLLSIKSLINSKIEATLINGEKIVITRKYIHEIRSILEKNDEK